MPFSFNGAKLKGVTGVTVSWTEKPARRICSVERFANGVDSHAMPTRLQPAQK